MNALSPESVLAEAGAICEPPASQPTQTIVTPAGRVGTADRFAVLDTVALLNLPERGYLLKGIISPSEPSVWWGPPKCGKSFLLLHIAYALAQGRQVFGRRVRQCRVLYLACEGLSGLRARVEALVRRYGHEKNFMAVAQPVDLWSPGGDTRALRALIEDHKPDLVVVDTINRVMAGGDENSSADMGAFIRHLDELRGPFDGMKFGPHVACIHHGTKDGRGGPRGHSSLLGAVDASVEISAAEDGTRTAKLDAMKDDAAGALAFQLEVEDLGPDLDGDARTTCLVVEKDKARTAKQNVDRLTPTQEGWLSAIRDIFAEKGKAQLRVPIHGMQPQVTLTREEIRQSPAVRVRLGAELGNATLTNVQRQSMHKALITLKDKGKIGLTNDLVWLL